MERTERALAREREEGRKREEERKIISLSLFFLSFLTLCGYGWVGKGYINSVLSFTHLVLYNPKINIPKKHYFKE